MSKKYFLFISIIFSIVFSTIALSNPINRKNAKVYAQTADKAAKSGDWEAARLNWAKAVKNSELGKINESTLSVFYYEYGRALGVTCFNELAEKYLLKSLHIDEKLTGNTYLPLAELTRLNLDNKDYSEATEYYKKLFPELDKLNASTKAPIAYADMLDEYSYSLLELGLKDKAEKTKFQANKIRSKHSRHYSITDRTPYGTKCTNPSNSASKSATKTDIKAHKTIPYPALENCMWIRNSNTKLYELDC